MDAYSFVGPFLRRLPPELAHRIAIRALQAGVGATDSGSDPACLRVTLLGQFFPNPIGLAAGFDKNGEVADAFPSVGFVEVGTVTPRPQVGNRRPRVFRLLEDGAVINRLGFNNDGMAKVQTRLERSTGSRVVGVNLGCNRDSKDRIDDYVAGLLAFAPVADYLAINVSSPNTPGLRDLQGPKSVAELMRRLSEARDSLGSPHRTTPIFLKLSPDLELDDLRRVVTAALDSNVDGLIVSNTTVSRPANLRSPERSQAGGLSGRPLFELSTRALREVYRVTDGQLPLVGVGGVTSADDAYTKIKAGASLVQLYTALIYHGPALVDQIKQGLADALSRDGLSTIFEAVGIEAA